MSSESKREDEKTQREKPRRKRKQKKNRRVVIAAARRKEKVREGRNEMKKNLLKCPITLRASQNSKLISSVKTY